MHLPRHVIRGDHLLNMHLYVFRYREVTAYFYVCYTTPPRINSIPICKYSRIVITLSKRKCCLHVMCICKGISQATYTSPITYLLSFRFAIVNIIT